MRFFLTGLVLVLTAVAGLAGWVWLRSEAHLRSFASPPRFVAPIPTDAQSLQQGRRLTLTRGCAGCHGQSLTGEVFHEESFGIRAVAPNLVTLARTQSPAVLERAIRHGIGHDGRALYSMPAYNFVRMSDTDLAALIGYLRSLPAGSTSLPKGHLGWPIRWALATGADAAVPAFVSKVPRLAWQDHPDPAVRRGEYLAMTSCNECHGLGLRGDDPFQAPGKGPPDLAMVASYDRGDFERLMRTGKAAGNREIRLMSRVARGRFSHWTPQEVDDLYAFFGALGRPDQ
jgi:mono/diheme cytochrome c family protein